MSVKVLVSEDDRSTRALLVRAIEELGYCAIQAADGLRAWELLEDNPDISLVTTDLDMPRLNGQEFIKKMRANSQFNSTPIIIISGVVGPNEIDGVLQLGASRFLPKPISVKYLREYVELLINRQQADIRI